MIQFQYIESPDRDHAPSRVPRITATRALLPWPFAGKPRIVVAAASARSSRNLRHIAIYM